MWEEVRSGASGNVSPSPLTSRLPFAWFIIPPTLLQVLLDAGATLELQDALGRSALMFAAGNNAPSTLAALLDAGACISQRDRRLRCAEQGGDMNAGPGAGKGSPTPQRFVRCSPPPPLVCLHPAGLPSTMPPRAARCAPCCSGAWRICRPWRISGRLTCWQI